MCIISIPAPLFKRGWHFVARFSHVCCRWRKTGLQGEDLLEVEPLVSRVRVMVSQEEAGLFIQSFGARGAAELLEQLHAFRVRQTQISAAQHEL